MRSSVNLTPIRNAATNTKKNKIIAASPHTVLFFLSFDELARGAIGHSPEIRKIRRHENLAHVVQARRDLKENQCLVPFRTTREKTSAPLSSDTKRHDARST